MHLCVIVLFNLFYLINCKTLFFNKDQKIVRRAAVGTKWPFRKIAFDFIDNSFSVSERNKIKDALKSFEDLLAVNGTKCLEFHQRTNETAYIKFHDGKACSSTLGYGSQNIISLNRTVCVTKTVVMHELLHRLGFDHEHSRHDREHHVVIDEKNIPDQLSSNFELNKNAQPLDTPYDYYSILHYNSKVLKKSVIGVIIPSLFGTNEINLDRETLSPIDVIQVQRMYGCTEAPIQHIEFYNASLNDSELRYVACLLKSEANLFKINTTVTDMYFNRTIYTCGRSHYWPVEYPLIPSDHELYKTICSKRKDENELCKISIECKENFLCKRVFFKQGLCKLALEDTNRFTFLTRFFFEKAIDGIVFVYKEFMRELYD